MKTDQSDPIFAFIFMYDYMRIGSAVRNQIFHK